MHDRGARAWPGRRADGAGQARRATCTRASTATTLSRPTMTGLASASSTSRIRLSRARPSPSRRSPTPGETTQPDPRHVNTVVVPNDPILGEQVVVTATIKNLGSPDPFLVDIEIYENGVKVAQEFYDNEVINTNASRDFTLQWTPSATGSYRVAVGLIGAGWGGLYEWTNEAALFTVSDVSPPSGSPV